VQTPATDRMPETNSANPADLRKLVLKLRWIGHEDEAQELCAELGRSAHDIVCVDELRVTD